MIIDLAMAVMFALVIALVLRVKNRVKDYKQEEPVIEAPPMSDPLPPLPVEEDGND